MTVISQASSESGRSPASGFLESYRGNWQSGFAFVQRGRGRDVNTISKSPGLITLPMQPPFISTFSTMFFFFFFPFFCYQKGCVSLNLLEGLA